MATAQIQSTFNQITQARQAYLSGLTAGASFSGDRHVWAKAFGSWTNQDNLNNVAGYRADTGGLMFGIDKVLSAQANLGLGFGVGQSSIKSNSTAAPSNIDLTSYQIGIYGGYEFGTKTALVYQLGGAINTNSSSRSLNAFSAVPGVGNNANGQYHSYVGYVGLGLNRQIPIAPQTTLTPEIRLDYLSVNTDGYTESGGGNLSLKVSSQTYNTLYSSANLRIEHALSEAIKVSASLGASYNALDTQATLTSAFLGGGPTFITNGLSTSPWMFNAGLGLSGHISETMTLRVSYNLGVSGSQFTGQMINAELKLLF